MKSFLISFLCTSLVLSGCALYSLGYERMTGLSEAIKALLNKNSILSTEYNGTVSDEVFNPADAYSIDDTAVLIKEKDRDFVILNITDIHFSDYDERAFMAFPACATVRRLVRSIKPDLITVTGDIVCGESAVYSIKRFTDMMDGFGIPWAPVFGNHEADGNCDYNYLADIMMKSGTCLLKKGDPSLGVGNYIVNIAERNGENLDIIHSLIMVDTHKTHANSSQIEWYKWAASGISTVAGHSVESSVMMHIPLAEYQYAFDEAWDSENKCWRDGYDASGQLNEKICCHRDDNGTPINNGFFAAAEEIGTTKNFICGHEHINNFSIVYRGIRLTYTLKVGHGSGYKLGLNGGTVININRDGLSLRHEYSI